MIYDLNMSVLCQLDQKCQRIYHALLRSLPAIWLWWVMPLISAPGFLGRVLIFDVLAGLLSVNKGKAMKWRWRDSEEAEDVEWPHVLVHEVWFETMEASYTGSTS